MSIISLAGESNHVLALKASVANQREVRWQVSKTNSFPAVSPNVVYDTGLRVPDGNEMTDDTIEIWRDFLGEAQQLTPAGAVASTTYYVSYMTRTTGGVSSGWATGVAITYGAFALPSTRWAGAQ